MLDQLTGRLDTLSSALQLRAQRQQILASNIANVDTPGYIARDIDFNTALQNATSGQFQPSTVATHAAHRTITSREGQIGNA